MTPTIQLTTPPDTTTTTTTTATMPPPGTATLSPHLLSNIFTSLSRDTRRWSLLRNLKSDNPLELNGELRGTASFTPLLRSNTDRDREMVYREEGELPNTLGLGVGMAGLRWTKKYIWRQQSENGRISVWFVKVDKSAEEEEADYLFHDFDFDTKTESDTETEDADAITFVTPPVPPAVMGQDTTTVVMARGNHLCINDMYRTAYAFRIRPESGEVLSWSSRHVVKGPKKNQDIVNLYRVEG